ncbi:winged helix-turn-helix transcriptional regulator [Meiothermus hypogaeus]|uniref:HxlR family transcriptional regulator n=2 Tax=Meiothermus hypogaeus TaxID=884155 RepID=A0A511R147_9DEIN|nr:helix-turn-helix domain-containing protein [Meiothermus hypogaeus]RIH75954.1 HTH-type transcriptional activator HxlR [Meiothermus hypogaeus]GEM83017.1 HxlR family transcriptional regulator [Meiothermus hypogaeus NBRC 106114]GIW36801.1 MAG: HxlR family transcriptional regulator [Meiothermus sp.]
MVANTVDVLNDRCPSRQVIALIADKWSILVLYALSREGTLRYGQLQRTVRGISQKMLTQTLRELERNGLVSRMVYEVVPPQVEYELTDLGKSLRRVLSELCGWAQGNLEQVARARELYDLEKGNPT